MLYKKLCTLFSLLLVSTLLLHAQEYDVTWENLATSNITVNGDVYSTTSNNYEYLLGCGNFSDGAYLTFQLNADPGPLGYGIGMRDISNGTQQISIWTTHSIQVYNYSHFYGYDSYNLDGSYGKESNWNNDGVMPLSVFKIERQGANINYYRDNVLMYTKAIINGASASLQPVFYFMGNSGTVDVDVKVSYNCSGGPTCNDGIQNGNETGVDCGGPDCAACPTCSDGIQNGNETGVDCGGPDCPACSGATCSDGIQNGNETGVDCGGPDCPACPTCSDGIQNGNETGVDCGGPDCSPCGTGCSSPTNLALGTNPTQDGTQNNNDADNAVDGDPNTWNSFSQTSWEPEAWWEVDLGSSNTIDEIKIWNLSPSSGNGDFLTDFHVFVSDVPFNGPSLSDAQNTPGVFDYHFTGPGAAGRPTNITVDHQGQYVRVQLAGTAFLAMAEIEIIGCSGGPTCSDGIQNGNETDVDCGGPDCPACPTCSDGVQNGNETGVDCGGPDCPACSGATCSDGVQNGNETGVDC
ncbi:MAG: discoidin domain-containing protein, partial [Bacteroidota bacterium]